MSERDRPPAVPQPQWSPTPDWQEDTAPGGQRAGAGGHADADADAPHAGAQYSDTRRSDTPYVSTPHSGAGASYAGAGSGTSSWAAQPESSATAPQYSSSPVTVRRPDTLAGLLLLLAGIAAGISLLLDWVSAGDATGWDLLQDGFEDFDSGTWQPPVIVLAGGALLVLGVLALLPGRSHKTVGVLALLATLPALVGAAVLLNLTDFAWDFFEAGFWVATAVPVLGLLGSLKAMLTGPRTR